MWFQVCLTWFKLGRKALGLLDSVAQMGRSIPRKQWIHEILETFALSQGFVPSQPAALRRHALPAVAAGGLVPLLQDLRERLQEEVVEMSTPVPLW
uniref:Uncharacterized protein n=1 Tax=Cyanistes caeruleus TaxID=156563 RepID=A0A8C0U491_CYACU